MLGSICLENRRRIADLILTWKLVNNLAPINFKFPLILRRLNNCRGHSFHLQPLISRPPLSKVRDFFTERVLRLWNQLPDVIVSATSLSSFKGRLDTFWSNE